MMDKVNFSELVCKRYSCRKLTGAPMTAEKLERILEAARIASIAHNEQSSHVLLLESPEAAERVHEIIPCIFEVNCSLIMAAVPGEAWVCESDQTNFTAANASIVAMHITLAIEAKELGMTWVGYLDASRAKELFPVTASYELIVLFLVGEKVTEAYPAHLYEKRELIAGFVERF